MLSTTSPMALAPMRAMPMRAMPLMSAEGTVADTVTGVVKPTADFGAVRSWYDSGVRLDGSTPDAFPAPAEAAAELAAEPAAPAPEPVAAKAPEPVAAAPAPEPVAAKQLRSDLGFDTNGVPLAAWNPKGLDVGFLPESVPLPGLKDPLPIKAQFDAEYLKTCPPYLDGSMPGDYGFDPWCLVALANPAWRTPEELDKTCRTGAERKAVMAEFSEEKQRSQLEWMRNSELKHGRLAMLAAAGWPLAELVSGPYLHLDQANGGPGLDGRVPSLFNGQFLENILPIGLVFGAIAYVEQTYDAKGGVGGDYGFDPLGFSTGKAPGPLASAPNVGDLEALKVAEIKNGRAAMMAITGFAVQEFVYGTPVVDQTPIFFGLFR